MTNMTDRLFQVRSIHLHAGNEDSQTLDSRPVSDKVIGVVSRR